MKKYVKITVELNWKENLSDLIYNIEEAVKYGFQIKTHICWIRHIYIFILFNPWRQCLVASAMSVCPLQYSPLDFKIHNAWCSLYFECIKFVVFSLGCFPTILPSEMFFKNSLCLTTWCINLIFLVSEVLSSALFSLISIKIWSFAFISVQLVFAILLQIHISIAWSLSLFTFPRVHDSHL